MRKRHIGAKFKEKLFNVDLYFSPLRQITVGCGWMCKSVSCLHWKCCLGLNAFLLISPGKGWHC